MENGPDRTPSAPQEPLRDWQKDTWYGPYPTHEDPFDEPDDAPELRDLRSEELNNRSGQFWESQTSGYRFQQNPQAPEKGPEGKQPERKPPKPPKQRKRRNLVLFLEIAGAALAVWLLAYYVLFSVRTIRVTGNSRISADRIIEMSGIHPGEPILALNSDAVERRIEQEPRLKMKYLDKQLPSTVVLSVREREGCCWMTWNGILYIMDKQRMILEESEREDLVIPAGEGDAAGLQAGGAQNADPEEAELREELSRLVKVDGLKIRSGAMTGQVLQMENKDQQVVFSELFLQMKVLSCTELIAEADLSNLGSLLLTTRDGFTVSMGGSENIHAKLRSMLLTREELLRMGYRGGVINVMLPETPIYSPPGS